MKTISLSRLVFSTIISSCARSVVY